MPLQRIQPAMLLLMFIVLSFAASTNAHILPVYLANEIRMQFAEVATVLLQNRRGLRGPDTPRLPRLEEILAKSNERFRQDMRVTRPTFDYLVCQLEPLLQRPLINGKRGPGKPRRPTDEQVAIAIYFMATGMSHRTVANQFGIGERTVSRIITDVSLAIRQRFQREVVKFPAPGDNDGWRRLRFGFAGHGSSRFPNVVGALDGTHIRIKAPPSTRTNPRAYYNRKRYYSYILQGIVGPNGEFLDFNCGWPGSVSDQRVWSNSAAHRSIHGNNSILPDHNIILADKIYELSRRVITPYRQVGLLTHQQRRFNKKFSQARSVVERGFGMLQGRFRCLADRAFELNYLHVPNIAAACIILHNICLLRHEPLDYEEWGQYVQRQEILEQEDFLDDVEDIEEDEDFRLLTPNQRATRLGMTIPLPQVATPLEFRDRLAEIVFDL